MSTAARVFSALDVHFAKHVAAVASVSDPNVLLAMSLVSRQSRDGHVCVVLSDIAGKPVATEDGVVLEGERWPDLAAWLKSLKESPVVGDGQRPTPLVLDPSNRLYLYRFWDHERRVLAELQSRELPAHAPIDAKLLQDGLARLFPQTGDAPNRQKLAALVAVTQRFSVITGGPGTGKTTAVTRLLALLAEQARARGERFDACLLAPTGKAAARLTEAVRAAKQGLAVDPAIKDAIVEDASTLHRALGASRSGRLRFRYGKDYPLVADVVLVDEASMIDLALMRRLLEAVPVKARLILLGDRHQLASVEAGAVLGDICGGSLAYDPPWLASLASLGGDSFAGIPTQEHVPAIARHVVELTQSYRFHPDRGIAKVSLCVKNGDAAGALRELSPAEALKASASRSDSGPESIAGEVVLIERSARSGFSETLRRIAVERFAHMLRESTPAAALAKLDAFRILCAHRTGPYGVEGVNEEIQRALSESGLIAPRGPFYRGRPILIRQNEYQLGLFNGDVGLLWPDPARGGQVSAFFATADGVRGIATAELPAHETVFAMSIHKSQGSEFDEIAVVLPDATSPLVSRELLYTALTRARHRAWLVGSKESVTACIRRPVARASGLRDALWV